MSSRRGSGTRNLSEVRRVLVVDDNRDSAELIAVVLEREGHEVRVAHHPLEALTIAQSFRPNIAFLDIGLPEIDGYELLRRLRLAPEHEGCAFVAVTGYDELRVLPSHQRGFDHHLVKPVDLSTVVDLVERLGRADLSRSASA
jgi:CheY-like chemotaxis protein